MINFRRKEFSIPEGHYTGPKEVDKIPGVLGLASKGALAGTVVGAVIGKVTKDDKVLDDALNGAKYGALAGIASKFFVNYLHKPMNRVKYQEVDKAIRQRFGIYQVQGINIGDSVSKRADISEKFEFNDRDVSKYKLNFAIHDNTVTMYTFGMSEEEFKKTDKKLDEYCKKYSGMSYSSRAINQKVNSYAVDIVFTNYQAICSFIMELQESLETKINLLDNNAIVAGRLADAAGQEKTFSVKEINKYDLIKIIGGGLGKGLSMFQKGGSALASSVYGLLRSSIEKLGNDELTKILGTGKRENFNNTFLESTLKKLHYVEGFNYTCSEKNNQVCMGLISGLFLVTVSKDSDDAKEIDNVFKKLAKVKRSDTGKVLVYSYGLKDRNEFEFILKKFMAVAKPNIFEG